MRHILPFATGLAPAMSIVNRFLRRIGLPVRVGTDSFDNKYYDQVRKGISTQRFM